MFALTNVDIFRSWLSSGPKTMSLSKNVNNFFQESKFFPEEISTKLLYLGLVKRAGKYLVSSVGI